MTTAAIIKNFAVEIDLRWPGRVASARQNPPYNRLAGNNSAAILQTKPASEIKWKCAMQRPPSVLSLLVHPDSAPTKLFHFHPLNLLGVTRTAFNARPANE